MSTQNAQTFGAFGSTDSPTLGDYGTGTTQAESPSRETTSATDHTEQTGIDDDAWELKQRWGITPRTLERRVRERAKPTRPNETECEECGKRVTETNSMGTVGHDSGWGSDKEPCPMYSGGDDA